MKLNLEIELDYIDDEGNVDDQIKQEIISKISKVVENNIKEKLDDIVLKAAQKKADEMCEQMVGDFINKSFTQTDQWGDKIHTNVTVKEILKNKFDKYWKESVDSQGRSKYDSYGPMQSRVNNLIDERIEKNSKQFADTLTSDTENKIKSAMKKNLQESIGAKLVSELGFDKLLLESKVK